MTKSLKDKDYCVAGIDMETGEWVRLVSSKDGDSCPKEFLDDSKVNVLDVIEVGFKYHAPYKTQKENWLIDESILPKKLGTKTIEQVMKIRLSSASPYVFGNDKNALSTDDVKNLNHSLEIIEATKLSFDTSLKGDGRHHYKIHFTYKGNQYHLSLTDPKFRVEGIDSWIIPKAIIVVSIPSEPYGESELFYKFAAKVFVR